MLLTNFLIVAINYICYKFNKQELEQKIEEILFLLDTADNVWFNHISELNSFIYKQVSKLFVLCYGLKKIENIQDFKKIKLIIFPGFNSVCYK